MNFNHLSDLGLRDETIDDLFLSQNTSNFDLNHVNGGGLTSSQLSQLLLLSNTTLGFQQNGVIPQRYQPSIGLGQLGFGQRMTEVRRTYVTPNRVQIHSFIDYSPLQNQMGFPPNEVTGFSEVMKTTRFLTPTSTIERLFAPNSSTVPSQGFAANGSACVRGLSGNNSVHFQRQPNFRNQTTISSSQVNHPTFNEIEPFFNLHRRQNRPLNPPTPRIFELDDRAEATGDGLVLDPKQLSPRASPNKGKNPAHDRNPRLNSNSSHKELNMPNIQKPNLGEHSRIQNQNDDEYDGRIHSLPCKKYGPYKCPKCKRVFDTSQTFAAHMWSHYKHETSGERKRRLAARNKKRNNLHLAHPSKGLTVALQSPNDEMRVYARKRKGLGEEKTEDEVEDGMWEKEKAAPSANAEKSPGDLKKVKEESIAENSHGYVKKIKEEPT